MEMLELKLSGPGLSPGLGRRLEWCRVAGLPLCPFSLDKPPVPCLVMWAQEDSSNASEIWKTIFDAEVFGLYGNTKA